MINSLAALYRTPLTPSASPYLQDNGIGSTVPVVAASLAMRHALKAASTQLGVSLRLAPGRTVPAQWTHSAVASTGGVDVLPRALVTDQLGLVQGVQSLGQGEAERRSPLEPTEATASQSDRACP